MKKFIIFVIIACSVGIFYALSTLKDMPDIFNWEDEDYE